MTKQFCLLSFLSLILSASVTPLFGDPILRVDRPIKDRYIVTLNQESPADVDAAVAQLRAATGGEVRHTFRHVLRGFSIEISENAAQKLVKNPWVESVTEVGISSLAQTQDLCTFQPGMHYDTIPADVWGLDLMDGVIGNPDPNACTTAYQYCSTGQGVRVYVMDGGVRSDKFNVGQVEYPATLPDYTAGEPHCWTMNNYKAVASHGTAVASIVAGPFYGVAKDVTLVDIRVFHCNGVADHDDIVAAFDWIATDPNRGSRSVVNASFAVVQTCSSLRCHTHPILQASNNLVNNYGVQVVAAAGNGSTSYHRIYPAFGSSIAVGGLAKDRISRWSHSNYGFNIDIYAPAQWVESDTTLLAPWDKRSELSDCDSYPDDSCTSGTSFAAPFVTGMVARYLENNAGATRDDVLDYLYAEAAAGYNALIDNGDGRWLPVVNVNDCY